MAIRADIFSFLLFLAFSNIAFSEQDCVYTVFIKTGSIKRAGTHSTISLKLSNEYDESVEIPNLEKWGGIMGEGHNYFEVGNLDIFSGKAKCLTTPVCSLNLTSDGSGPYAGWYCDYVEIITITGVRGTCSHEQFTVEQWLASDEAPYKLTAIKNNCLVDKVKSASTDVAM